MIPFISNLLDLPVTRKEVLKRVKKVKDECLCYSITHALHEYNIFGTRSNYPEIYFPKFIRRNALKFGADKQCDYWWKPEIWDTGRMNFLDWLIEQYKDDKTNLRKL